MRGGVEVRVLCSASAEVQVLLTAEYGQSSNSPLASTHTTLAAPEVLVTTSYMWPHYHRVVVKFLNLYQVSSNATPAGRACLHHPTQKKIPPAHPAFSDTTQQRKSPQHSLSRVKSRFSNQPQTRRMREGAAVFLKSVLSPGCPFSGLLTREQTFLGAPEVSPLVLPGCQFFRPKSGIYKAKKKTQGTQFCVISEVPIYQYHYTSFSPPFSLVCVLYILPSVFRYTQWNREIPLLIFPEISCISNYLCVDLVLKWQQESKPCFTIH